MKYSPDRKLTDRSAKTERQLQLEDENIRLTILLQEGGDTAALKEARQSLKTAQAELAGINEGALYDAFREALEAQGYKVAEIEPAKPGGNAELVIALPD